MTPEESTLLLKISKDGDFMLPLVVIFKFNNYTFSGNIYWGKMKKKEKKSGLFEGKRITKYKNKQILGIIIFETDH